MTQRKAYKHGYEYGLRGVATRNTWFPKHRTNQYNAWQAGWRKGMAERIQKEASDGKG